MKFVFRLKTQLFVLMLLKMKWLYIQLFHLLNYVQMVRDPLCTTSVKSCYMYSRDVTIFKLNYIVIATSREVKRGDKKC